MEQWKDERQKERDIKKLVEGGNVHLKKGKF